MTHYNTLIINLSKPQLIKLKPGMKNSTKITLNLPPN